MKTSGRGEAPRWCKLEELPRAAAQPNHPKPGEDHVQTPYGVSSGPEEEQVVEWVLGGSAVFGNTDTSAAVHF